jgi:hypothetical protein
MVCYGCKTGWIMKIAIGICLLALFLNPAFAAEKPEIFAQKGHNGKIRYLALSPNEDLLLSIADQKIETNMESAVKLWDVKSKRILKDIKVKEKITFFIYYQAGFSSDGIFVYFWDDNQDIFIYNIKEDTYRKYDLKKYFSSQQLFHFDRSIVSADISDNIITIRQQSQDHSVADNDYDDRDVEVVKKIDANSGKLISELKNKTRSIVRPKKGTLFKKGISPNEIVFSKDRSNFYTVKGKCTLRDEDEALLNLYSAKFNDVLVSTIRLQNIACGLLPIRYAIAFSGKYNKFLTGHTNGDIIEWDSLSGREIARLGSESSIEIQTYIEAGFKKYLVTLANGWIIWDVINGRMIKSSAETKNMEEGKIFDYLNEKSIRIDENNKKAILLGPEAESVDKRLKAKRVDGIVKLIDNLTGREIAEFISFEDGEWIVITPEGYFNASTNGAKHLNVRVGNKVYSIDNFYEKFFNPVYVASVLQGKRVEAVADIRNGILSPPDVRITSPAPGKEFSTDTLTVTVAAKDTGGGIDEIRLYHNGKAIGEDTRAVKIASRGGEAIREYTVSLVDGVNTFKAVGFSKDRTESNPYELVVKLTAPSKDVSLYVFAVGINKYKNPALNLNYAEPDARSITDFFKLQGKELFKNVEIREIYNEQATKENILSRLSQLQSINPQDVVLIYLAGHGDNISEKWYFIPHELTYPEREEDVRAKGISSDELSGYMKNIKAQKILLLIDACKAGAVLIAFRGFEDRKALSQLSRSTGVHIVAASTKDQFAAEVKELGHGVFTYTLLEGLKGKAAGKGQTVTVRKLMGYIEEQLPDITKKYKQEAQYPVVDSRGMDFPLVIVK